MRESSTQSQECAVGQIIRGYRDVILPMTVLRRLDAVLQSSKQAVFDMLEADEAAGQAW